MGVRSQVRATSGRHQVRAPTDSTPCTACADGLIRLFKPSAAAAAIVFKGHTEPVRALAKVLPEDKDSPLFASCSNDGCAPSSRLSQVARLTLHFI